MSNALRAVTETLAEKWSPCATHPFRAIVRTWLRDGGDDPARFERVDEEDGSIYWHMSVDPGISLIVRLYEDPTGRAFFVIEAAIAKFPVGAGEGAMRALLELNRTAFEAFRVGLMDEGGVTCLARGRCEGYAPEYFRHLLDSIIEFSREVQRDLLEKHGAAPFRERA